MFENRIQRYYANHRAEIGNSTNPPTSQSVAGKNVSFVPLPQEFSNTPSQMTAMSWLYSQAFQAAKWNQEFPPTS